MVSSGTIFGRSKELWDETSYNGYCYYQYEPIKWKILSNDGEKLIPYEFNKKFSVDTILYAKWRPYIKVSYQTNSGGTIQNQIIVEGNPVEEPLALVREGYVFTGWFMDVRN